jgi:hypothetical protein
MAPFTFTKDTEVAGDAWALYAKVTAIIIFNFYHLIAFFSTLSKS